MSLRHTHTQRPAGPRWPLRTCPANVVAATLQAIATLPPDEDWLAAVHRAQAWCEQAGRSFWANDRAYWDLIDAGLQGAIDGYLCDIGQDQ